MSKLKCVFLCLVALSMGACATIIDGTKQTVPIKTNPPNAKVYVDGSFVGTSPVVVSLERGEIHKVGLVMPNHELGLIEVDREINPMVFTNVIFVVGAPLAILFDATMGSLYNTVPDEINHQMVMQENVPRVE